MRPLEREQLVPGVARHQVRRHTFHVVRVGKRLRLGVHVRPAATVAVAVAFTAAASPTATTNTAAVATAATIDTATTPTTLPPREVARAVHTERPPLRLAT